MLSQQLAVVRLEDVAPFFFARSALKHTLQPYKSTHQVPVPKQAPLEYPPQALPSRENNPRESHRHIQQCTQRQHLVYMPYAQTAPHRH